MAETVTTGGNVSFEYKKGKQPKLDEERKKAIAQGYEEYNERKRKERRTRNIIIGIIVIVALIILGFALVS